jgi:hypothetical protein
MEVGVVAVRRCIQVDIQVPMPIVAQDGSGCNRSDVIGGPTDDDDTSINLPRRATAHKGSRDKGMGTIRQNAARDEENQGKLHRVDIEWISKSAIFDWTASICMDRVV